MMMILSMAPKMMVRIQTVPFAETTTTRPPWRPQRNNTIGRESIDHRPCAILHPETIGSRKRRTDRLSGWLLWTARLLTDNRHVLCTWEVVRHPAPPPLAAEGMPSYPRPKLKAHAFLVVHFHHLPKHWNWLSSPEVIVMAAAVVIQATAGTSTSCAAAVHPPLRYIRAATIRVDWDPESSFIAVVV
jgi:hypothetical protein